MKESDNHNNPATLTPMYITYNDMLQKTSLNNNNTNNNNNLHKRAPRWDGFDFFPLPVACSDYYSWSDLSEWGEDERLEGEISKHDRTFKEHITALSGWLRVVLRFYRWMNKWLEQRTIFAKAMQSTPPQEYTYPYKSKYATPRAGHEKAVGCLREMVGEDNEVYCAYCDVFTKHVPHDVGPNHPHHAFCYCTSCTSNFNRLYRWMSKTLREVGSYPLLARAVGFERELGEVSEVSESEESDSDEDSPTSDVSDDESSD